MPYADPEQQKEYLREWRAANPDYFKVWREDHPGYHNGRWAKNKATYNANRNEKRRLERERRKAEAKP